jgi:hypothetical protein
VRILAKRAGHSHKRATCSHLMWPLDYIDSYQSVLSWYLRLYDSVRCSISGILDHVKILLLDRACKNYELGGRG